MKLSNIENSLHEEILTGTTRTGLKVLLNPKTDFSKSMGIFGVRFGSTDNAFLSDGKAIEVPEGTAHFLEHKLFEDKDGDVSDRFSSNGASCNAGTGFTSTSYLFICTDKFNENLRLLLNFVQNPYFTKELIEKEQGIIGQEIKMYNDDPDWIVFFNLMKCLYREHPVRLNIAGSVESISSIDVEVLERCYNAFYRPGNMILALSGRFDIQETVKIIEDDSLNRAPDSSGMFNDRKIIEKETAPADNFISQNMVVARNKILLGFKDFDIKSVGEEQLKKEIVTQMVIAVLLGKSSDNYEKLYNEGVIDDTFSAYYSGHIDFGFSIIGGDVNDPNRFKDQLHRLIEEVVKNGVDQESYLRQKNKYLGKFIRTFNSIESSASNLLNFSFKGLYPHQVIDVIDKISVDDLNRRLRDHFDLNKMACSIIEPNRNNSHSS